MELKWDQVGEKYYETGVQKGVLYPQSSNGTYPSGVAWSGLTGVTESPSGAEPTDIYADDAKYLSLISAESLSATIEAYQSPEEFDACDGTAELTDGVTIGQQDRQAFGFCYRTTEGNDTEGNSYGYKIHILYGCKASPSEKGYSTINDSPEAITFSWSVNTTPVPVDNKKPTSLLVIDSKKVDSAKLAKLEKVLYGSTDSVARLPLPAEIVTILTTEG